MPSITEYDDLDLTRPEDVATFRKRVHEELVDLSFKAVIRMACEATGYESSQFANRHIAVRAIADRRLSVIQG